jgi:hypothetical protein
MNRRFWIGLLAALSLLVSFPAFATTLYAMVHLEGLTQLKAQEKSGDELYINIADSYSNKVKKDVSIPPTPLYWRLDKNSHANNITLWQGKLVEGESASIIFTVLEHDLPPYNPHDHIGAMTLILKNTNGKLQSNWANGLNTKSTIINNSKDKTYPTTTKFYMNGSGSIYEMVLSVKLS